MIETIRFEKIPGKFEGIEIFIHDFSIDRFAAIDNTNLPEHTPFTNVWEDINFHYYGENDLGFTGKVYLCLRNQREGENTILFILFNLMCKATYDRSKSHVFAKVLQYLFDLIKEKTKSGEITDKDGSEFTPPAYHYSSAHFEHHFGG